LLDVGEGGRNTRHVLESKTVFKTSVVRQWLWGEQQAKQRVEVCAASDWRRSIKEARTEWVRVRVRGKERKHHGSGVGGRSNGKVEAVQALEEDAARAGPAAGLRETASGP
jgi:hypothetical protein